MDECSEGSYKILYHFSDGIYEELKPCRGKNCLPPSEEVNGIDGRKCVWLTNDIEDNHINGQKKKFGYKVKIYDKSNLIEDKKFKEIMWDLGIKNREHYAYLNIITKENIMDIFEVK